jgi:hypothetical protein
MKTKDRNIIKDTVEQEGFDYAFRHYSHFEDVKDQEFHRLRENYLKASQELIDYCGIEE